MPFTIPTKGKKIDCLNSYPIECICKDLANLDHCANFGLCKTAIGDDASVEI